MVLWLDEMGVRSDAAAGRSWAPVGQTPVIKRTGKRFRVNMISAISNAGRLRFRLFVGSFNGPVFIDFLGRLLRDCGGQKVHLIVDGHPVHHAKLVSAWVGRHAERIELHFLPGYSPELNPVELLNHDVKANAAGRRRPRSASELRDELHGYLRRRQRQPQVLVRFFDHPTTGMPPPHESHHLPAAVMVEAPRAREPVEISIEPPEAAMLAHPPDVGGVLDVIGRTFGEVLVLEGPATYRTARGRLLDLADGSLEDFHRAVDQLDRDTCSHPAGRCQAGHRCLRHSRRNRARG